MTNEKYNERQNQLLGSTQPSGFQKLNERREQTSAYKNIVLKEKYLFSKNFFEKTMNLI